MAEILLLLLALVGVGSVLCLIWCRVTRPVSGGGLWTVVRARDAGEGLEQRVQGLVWLQSCGLLRCPVVVVDAGLDEQGRALAERLAARWPQVILCSWSQLARQFEL